MAVSGSSFVDEIYDQFLVCRMCSEVYTSPKVLSCMHSFCEKCLETHYDMEEQERPYRFLVYNRALNCPLCHSRTELPTGGIHRLPDNLLVANLSGVVGRCKPGPSSSSATCEICRPGALDNEADGGDRVAVSKCLDCVKLLCGACTELHRNTRVTQHHGLFDFLGGEGGLDSQCKRHQREALRFYCEECEECVCVLCTFHDHRDHDVTSLIEALGRHRRPFEALMDRCRGRIDGLRAQVELIERCERGLKRAEERIRDAAIDAIAAIRKREKDLLAEIRDSLDEQTMGFIGEKDVFKENLRNLEGSFDQTNAMLNGTKLDLLIVRKEMEKKLTLILESGMKSTPDLLKRSVPLYCDEPERDDYYPDVVQAAFDRMGKSDRFLGHRNTEVQTVATETDLDPDPEFAPDLISKLDQTDDDDSNASAPDPIRGADSTWRRPLAVVVATDTPRSFGTVTLRPIDGLPRTREAATQTPRPVLVEGSTEMPRIVLYEKETNTPFVHVTQKGVSTDNQVMVDKTTSTIQVDVTAAYRGAAATTKRSVMVSRGTCTPRTMTADRETSLSVPSPTSTAARGCSPVDWIGVSDESVGGNPSMLQAPPNYSADHVTSKSAQENTSTVRSTPSVVGMSTPSVVGMPTTAAVGASTPSVVGMSTSAAVRMPTPAAVGASTPAAVGASTTAAIGMSTPSVVGASTPSVVGMSTTAAVRMPTTAAVRMPTTAAVGMSTPAAVGMSTPAAVGVSTTAAVGASTPAVVGARGVGKTQAQYKQDEPKLSPPATSSHQPSPASAAVNTSTPPSAATQTRPREGQGSSRGQEVSRNPVPLNQIQVGKVVIEEPATLSKVQLTPASQGNKDLIRSPPALPGSNPMPGTKGGQLYSQVLGQKSINGTQIPSPGTEVPFAPGPPQVCSQTPGSVPGSQSVTGNQRIQVPLQGSANVPGVQTTPESPRFQVPIASPGLNYMPPTSQGSQVRITGPANIPGVQSIPGTQGSQVRTVGPTNVPGVQSMPGAQASQVRIMGPTNVPVAQSIPGTQGQVRTIGPTNVPGAQSIPGTQGSQVRTLGPTNLPGTQFVPGTQGQVRTVGPTNVPGAQTIPGIQGSQVRNIGPTNVPGVQSIPGTQGPVRTMGPPNVPGVQFIPGTQASQVRILSPANVPGVQSIPGTQGQVRTVGPTNVPGVQSIPGTQESQVRTIGPTNVPGTQFVPGAQASQVRPIGPTNVPGLQSIPGTQASQVRTMGPTNVPGVQFLPGTQGQVRTVGPTNVPGVQSISGTQASQVRTLSPANVPGTQFVPGTHGGPVRTEYTSPEAATSRVLTGAQIISSIAGTSAIVEAKGALTAQVSKQNGDAKTVTSKDNYFHASLSTKDRSSEPLRESTEVEKKQGTDSLPSIQLRAPVQSVIGSQALNPTSESHRHNVTATPANQDAPKMSSAETQNQPRSREVAAISGNLPPVSTSSPVSRLLVNDANKSAAGHLPQTSPVQEKATTSGSKPDGNPQDPTIPLRPNDQLNPNPSTDKPKQQGHF